MSQSEWSLNTIFIRQWFKNLSDIDEIVIWRGIYEYEAKWQSDTNWVAVIDPLTRSLMVNDARRFYTPMWPRYDRNIRKCKLTRYISFMFVSKRYKQKENSREWINKCEPIGWNGKHYAMNLLIINISYEWRLTLRPDNKYARENERFDVGCAIFAEKS